MFARAALGLSASVRYTTSDPQRLQELETAIAKLDPNEMVLRPAPLATLRRQLGFVDTPEADLSEGRGSRPAGGGSGCHGWGCVRRPPSSRWAACAVSLRVDDPAPLGQLAAQHHRGCIGPPGPAGAAQVVGTARRGRRSSWVRAALFRRVVAEYRGDCRATAAPIRAGAVRGNMIAAVAQIEGRFDDAEDVGQEALAHASTIDDGNFSWVYSANPLVWAPYDLGSGDRRRFELMKAVRSDFGDLAYVRGGAGRGRGRGRR